MKSLTIALATTSSHPAKFGQDRFSDHGDIAVEEKKRKKERNRTKTLVESLR